MVESLVFCSVLSNDGSSILLFATNHLINLITNQSKFVILWQEQINVSIP